MYNYISNDFILTLISTSNMVEIISSIISLKRIGNYYKACCPFHEEKNPSFTINIDKDFYFCFGCKSHGNIVDFLMKFYKFNFIESIKRLAEINGVKLIYKSKSKKIFTLNSKKKKFYYLMNKMNKFYHLSLLNSKDLEFVRVFLFNRGLTIKIIKKFFIGYSSVVLFNNFISTLKYKDIVFLLKLDVLSKKKCLYDKLCNRIIFPIMDVNENIVAFGGRSINDRSFCKYLNSSSNIFFSKIDVLYGLNYVIKNNFIIKKILVVEGYTDVIMLNQYGFNYVVGLLGSNIHEKQIRMLFYHTNKIIFCFDGDTTGLNSSKRILKKLFKYIDENKSVYFVILPLGEDPDSLIRKEGKYIFKKRIKNSQSIFDFLFESVSEKLDMFSLQDKSYFVNCIIKFISIINSKIMKIFLYQKLMSFVGVNNLSFFINSYLNFSLSNKLKYNSMIFLRYLITILLKKPKFSNLINVKDILFKNINIPLLNIFFNIVVLCLNNKNISLEEIIGFYENKKISVYLRILISRYFFFLDNKNIKFIFINLLNKFKIFIIDRKLNNMLVKEKYYGLTRKEKEKVWFLLKLKTLN